MPIKIRQQREGIMSNCKIDDFTITISGVEFSWGPGLSADEIGRQLADIVNRQIAEANPVNRTTFCTQVADAIGDITCVNNARSQYLQCAVNPTGNCAECPHFEATPHEER
jgi:hypothetical protein